MTPGEPMTSVDARFSEPDAAPTPWAQARDGLADAELYWLTTVRADGRPHVTPLIGVWHEEALWFTTGGREQKAHNLAGRPHCVMATGTNVLHEGLDVVVEGDAERVGDDDALRRLAEAFLAKYGEEWSFTVREGELHPPGGGSALAFRVRPAKAFAFRKGHYAQTRYRF
ncbi:pyridoxamine 5'-phosphate oxidase family protein [Streptomyces sp. 4N509B]|uniref:pyridoxamine 5'-phosphate oxidase family protein n=1 Tax=Streptomyces sp. 4N509B TaxID=3457413 RepID=UPI003FCFB8FA